MNSFSNFLDNTIKILLVGAVNSKSMRRVMRRKKLTMRLFSTQDLIFLEFEFDKLFASEIIMQLLVKAQLLRKHYKLNRKTSES